MGLSSSHSVWDGSLSEPAPEARFITETGTAAAIAELAEPVLESLGFRLVLVRIIGGQGPIVEIMAERPDGTMSIEDCRTVSLNLSPLLDVHDPMPESSYRLQVSSPGIDRPLVRLSDFEQWAGYDAKIETKELISGRRRFRGVIEGYEGDEARIEVELPDAGRQVLGLPVALIADAKLVLTDELVRESLRRGKRALKDANNVDVSEDVDASSDNDMPQKKGMSPKKGMVTKGKAPKSPKSLSGQKG